MRPEFSRKRSIFAAFFAFLPTACLAGAGLLAQGQGQAHPGEYSQTDVTAGAKHTADLVAKPRFRGQESFFHLGLASVDFTTARDLKKWLAAR